MATQHCIQTIVGHRCEIWTLALAPLPQQHHESSGETASLPHQEYLLLTGSSDEMIRGYAIGSLADQTASGTDSAIDLSDEVEVLKYVGGMSSQGGEKCTGAVPPFCLPLPPSHLP
jgi:hypothetical protein